MERWSEDPTLVVDGTVSRSVYHTRERKEGNTVEPLTNGHIETEHFVHYTKMYCHYNRLMHRKVSFIQRCPLLKYHRFHCI